MMVLRCLVLFVLAGCGTAALEPVPVPRDGGEVFVFYPVAGRIHVRVAGDAFEPAPDFVEVRTPSGASANARMIAGSYWAELPDAGDGYVDVTALDERDPPQALRAEVPPHPLPAVAYTCCQARRTCQAAPLEGEPCPDPRTGALSCRTTADCASLEGITIPLAPGDITATQREDRVELLVDTRAANVLVVAMTGSRTYAALTDDTGFMLPIVVPAEDTAGLTVQILAVEGQRSKAVGLAR